jgi:hypothetical protein
MVTKETEKTEGWVNTILEYARISTPTQKTGTLHTIIEGTLKEYDVRLSERKIEVVKDFERNLPETIVPDEELKYMVRSILQYLLAVVPPEGYLRFSTRSLARPSPEERRGIVQEGRVVEILVIFTGAKKRNEKRPLGLEIKIDKKEEMLSLQFWLLEGVVKRNRGTLISEVDEQKTEVLISLTFPVERRRIAFYEPGSG